MKLICVIFVSVVSTNLVSKDEMAHFTNVVFSILIFPCAYWRELPKVVFSCTLSSDRLVTSSFFLTFPRYLWETRELSLARIGWYCDEHELISFSENMRLGRWTQYLSYTDQGTSRAWFWHLSCCLAVTKQCFSFHCCTERTTWRSLYNRKGSWNCSASNYLRGSWGEDDKVYFFKCIPSSNSCTGSFRLQSLIEPCRTTFSMTWKYFFHQLQSIQS